MGQIPEAMQDITNCNSRSRKQPTQSTNKEDAETHLVQFAKHEVRPRSRLRSLGKRQQSRQGKRPRISVPIFRERFAERLECFRSRRPIPNPVHNVVPNRMSRERTRPPFECIALLQYAGKAASDSGRLDLILARNGGVAMLSL